ncbi:thiol-disulfide oxidoreductase DCC family protein [Methylovirgula sp. 4M-Z18]|uniref:thiol-disulfide oxidoreductase DCC family protein n=1 Tax=Methylovirgula sp. 4M-Z18 TaxID=2293567 RepID=UPI000E2F629A|nr:DCC1-like thiol-disulfide oxidoreductase family protein [Methylovirgula sp. 4M-Z18]RFB81229.1 DUF393 domain-containing protein [Methylovirgula sp. 4M-Z18]
MTGVPLFIFDDTCVLCSAVTRFVLRHERDHVIRFIGLRSHEGRVLAARYHIDVDDPTTFLFVEGNMAFSRSDGVLALALHLRWPARAVGLVRFVPRVARDWLYDWVARHRYRLFGQVAQCVAPDAASRHRFSLPDMP